MPSDRGDAATGPLALATQCFAPDFGGIEVLMTGLADALAASGREIEVFADHIRRRDAGELARPYPIRRFGSIRPVRRWMKRRALAERAEPGFAGVFAEFVEERRRDPRGGRADRRLRPRQRNPAGHRRRARAPRPRGAEPRADGHRDFPIHRRT